MADLYSHICYWLVQQPRIISFHWTQKETWGSSIQFLATLVISYLTLVLILSTAMKNINPPFKLRFISSLHNLFLLLLSFLMALATTLSALTHLPNPLKHILCFPPKTLPQGPIFFWSYVFYLSKIFEFSDTLINILKKKPLTFLHVYHHALVVVMCYVWLNVSQSLMVVALVTNALVHTLMYSYYFMCSIGYRPKWKRLVTDCQIVQFVFSFAVSVGFLWLHFVREKDGCSGFKGWVFNAVFNASLLALFLNFHTKNYKTQQHRTR